MKSTAQVADGITFVEAGVLSMLEGYTVDRNPELDVNRIDITTPNNDPMVKAAYQIREESGMAFGMPERQRRGGDPLPAARGHL